MRFLKRTAVLWERLRRLISGPHPPERTFEVTFRPHLLERLEFVQELGGLKSQKEVADAAYSMLLWAVDKRIRQVEIGTLNPGEAKLAILRMPFLDRCADAALERGITRLPPVPY